MRFHKVLKVFGIALIAAFLMLGIVGCGGGDAAEDVSTITLLIPDDPVGFNGLTTDTGYEQLLGELVMLSLTDIDPYGEIYPELAVDLPTLENGGVVFDEEYWTMDVTWQIRDDIYWADGEQVTVDDIIFTWNVATDEETGVWVDGVDYTDELEKIDDFTFKVYYNSVYTAYLTQFGGENFFVYPEHYCDATQGLFELDCDRDPLSSGPYVLEEWLTGDHLTFVKNENYYEEGKPSIEKIIVQIVPEQSVRRTMMLEGDADHHMWPSDAIMEEYDASDNVDMLISPTQRWVMRLFMNQAEYGTIDAEASPHPWLSDVNVRRAIRAAIDVDTIIDDIFLGHGEPIWTEFFREPYVCDIPRPAYDPQAAMDMLEAAGWTDGDGDGIRECNGCATAEDGTPMVGEFTIYAEYGPELDLAQQYIAENLLDIGISLELFSLEGSIMWDMEVGQEAEGRFDINMWDDGYPGLDPTDNAMWYYYHSDAVDPDWGGWNIARWSNEDFDLWYDELFYLDEEYRQEVFCEMALILEDELPQILLFSTLEAHGVATRINGALPSANDPITWNVADWTLDD
jgi:peptide/nickel transport system substrate-binding protein